MMDKFIEFVKAHKVGILVCLLIIAVGVACVAIGYIIGSSGNDGSAPENSNTVTENSNTVTEADSNTNADTEIVADSDYYKTEGYDLGDDYEAELDYCVITEKDPLNIRKDHSQKSKKIGKIPGGQSVYVEDTYKNWGYTDYEGTSGWINLDYCVSIHQTTVWVTLGDDAECYHMPWCSTIQDYNPIQVKSSYAKNTMNRRECTKCFGKVDRLFEKNYGFTIEECLSY